MTEDQNLGSAFGDKGTKANQIAYGHPYAEKILEEAREVLRESETGAHLLKVAYTHNVPIHIIKGNGPGGYNPQAKVIYLQATGQAKKVEFTMIINLVKALREADQEFFGLTLPDPLKDVMEYAAVLHTKNMDSITFCCKVVKELSNSSHFSVLLDALAELNYSKVYQAYEAGASQKEIYRAYAGIEES